ncbi:MAG: alpha/beta hydrolase [Leptospiraceae bacterium]|nr:alpha/beta hydrolase [Leptospiraceae bacterium]
MPTIKIPDDYESYINEKEAKFLDITPGAEKKLVMREKGKKTEYAIVYIHGFSASRQETSPVTELISQKINANVFYTRLRGHGRGGEAFGKTDASEWIYDAMEAYEIGKKIGNKIFIIAVSTGVPLSLWLAEHDRLQPERKIAGMALLSPNIYPKNKTVKLLLYPAGLEFAKLVSGKRRTWKPYNEMMKKYWTYDYALEGIRPMVVLVESLKNYKYEEQSTPAIFIYTEKDEVIDVEEVKTAYKRYGGKKKELFECKPCKNHILAGNIISPETNEYIAEKIVNYFNSL